MHVPDFRGYVTLEPQSGNVTKGLKCLVSTAISNQLSLNGDCGPSFLSFSFCASVLVVECYCASRFVQNYEVTFAEKLK